MRGLKHDKTARTLLRGYVVNYNYCWTHQSIGKTPAQAAGLNVKGWKQLIQEAQVHRVVNQIQARKTHSTEQIPAVVRAK